MSGSDEAPDELHQAGSSTLGSGAFVRVPVTPDPNPATSYITQALPHGTYFWRVCAHNKDTQKWGAWSTGGTGSFQVDVP